MLSSVLLGVEEGKLRGRKVKDHSQFFKKDVRNTETRVNQKEAKCAPTDPRTQAASEIAQEL